MKHQPVPLAPEALRRRADAAREGIASAAIEGGSVTPEAQAIINDWAQGRISEDLAIERIKARHTKTGTP